MAQHVIEELSRIRYDDAAIMKCQAALDKGNYPRVFSYAQKACGKEGLMRVIDELLKVRPRQGRIYEYISSWPFSCYLTTNFDDFLRSYLEAQGVPATVRRNSLDDMKVVHSTSRDLIVKIHGDTTGPEDIVLTEEQYEDFKSGQARQYWRDTLLAVLKMVDLVLIGYSASDPDLRDQLERARGIAAPDHPIFMFAADFPAKDITEYYQHLNIRIIPYSNGDGAHQELSRLMRRYDPFIAKRNSSSIGLEPIDESVAEAAASVHIFTQLRLDGTSDACIERTYASVILGMLSEMEPGARMTVSTLQEMLNGKIFAATGVDPTALGKALDSLYSPGYISFAENGHIVVFEQKGMMAIAQIRAERELVLEKFQNSCHLFLRQQYPSLDDRQRKSIIDALRDGLVRAFRKRGMEIARSILMTDPVDVSDATDILEIINAGSADLGDGDPRPAFGDLMLEIILRPNEEMKHYLAALSQGYFAYHALGLEPRCSTERLKLAQDQAWVFDSSVLLPILAIDCQNHGYAADLLARMKVLGFQCVTTERLFEEVRDHAWWAVANFREAPMDSPLLLQAAMSGPGFKQNLFLDGFTKWSLGQGAPSLDQYMKQCLSADYRQNLSDSIRAKIQSLKIDIVDFRTYADERRDLWAERDAITNEIQELRNRYGTWRGESQCIAEAEVVLICRNRNAAFLSQSGILNKLKGDKAKISWYPEALYRFLSLFSSSAVGPDLLYECMIQSFYYAGFDIIDKATISKYASRMVRQARMRIDEERDKYIQALGPERFAHFREDFERVPDEQKPFYSMQFAFYVASQETEKRKVAEERAKQAETSRRLSEKEQAELVRLRSKQLEKRRKAQQRRRRAQSRGKKRR
ncbi:MAG: SIR2 family protein [Candidatus Eisenbacteria bacterium]